MANNVFANGREISCKKADGKTICEFPDVCFTPPENPATPPGVPVPYPNTAFAKDATEGSKSVKISGQEVMLKNVSYFKTSTGDEAGSAAKKGMITSTNKGKAYFISWSMDVKYEGKNVVRHMDMTTNNHASPMSNGPPKDYGDSGVPPTDPKCEKILGSITAITYTDRPPTPPGGRPQGMQGLAIRWKEYAENIGKRGGKFATNHLNEYRKLQKKLQEEIDRWDSNNCEEKTGKNLPPKARQYAAQEPQLGPGQPTEPPTWAPAHFGSFG